MSWLGWALVIFLTALVTILGTAWLTGRDGCVATEQPRERKRSGGNENADRWLPRAGYFDLPDTLARFDRTYGGKVHDIHGGPGQDCWCGYVGHHPRPYGPFPVDTGPLLILSEKAAANVALEREIEQRCAEAEAKIPPRWRS